MDFAGRDAVAAIFSQGNNLNAFLPFLTGNEEFESKMKKSVCNRYASVLMNVTLQHSDNVDYLERFGSKLLTIPKRGNSKFKVTRENFFRKGWLWICLMDLFYGFVLRICHVMDVFFA